MLIEKDPNLQDKIVTIKLVSGEEILAQCLEYDPRKTKCIRIKQPILMPRKMVNGEMKVTFEPWMLSVAPAEIISLKLDHILYVSEASGRANTEYARVTNPGNNVE